MFDLLSLAKNAKKASKDLLNQSEEKINKVLRDSAKLLRENAKFLKEKNSIDIENGKKKGLSDAFIDRLTLTDEVIESIACGLEQVATLSSPVDKVVYEYENEFQGISIKKINVPFGVIGIIFESRPNVTADAFALSFKTKNAVILRGGSDAINSNIAIVGILKQALNKNGVNENAVSLIEDTTHEVATAFMKLNGYVDLLIPRGGANLIDSCIKNATVPIIETGKGNCHIYIDEFADIEKSVKVVVNAKTQRYSVCNACESLVIHSKILEKALVPIAEKLEKAKVIMRCDEKSFNVIKEFKNTEKATEEDYFKEYDAPLISIKVVDNIDEAISHINLCSTNHSESIMTENSENAEKFLKEIDSACVYHNASTRFSDGFIFGLGAEIGISTQKLHARGPMGLDALLTTKSIVKGDGAVRK